MSLPEETQKIKGLLARNDRTIRQSLHVLIVALASAGGFLLGKGTGPERAPLAITEPSAAEIRVDGNASSNASLSTKGTSTDSRPVSLQEGQYVASKNGTKYHHIDCPGVSTIKESNKIYFPSELAARNAGYLPASNCPLLAR